MNLGRRGKLAQPPARLDSQLDADPEVKDQEHFDSLLWNHPWMLYYAHRVGRATCDIWDRKKLPH